LFVLVFLKEHTKDSDKDFQTWVIRRKSEDRHEGFAGSYKEKSGEEMLIPLTWFVIASTSASVFGVKYESESICTLRPKFNFFIFAVSGKCSDTPVLKLQARTSDCLCAGFEKNLRFCAQ
jgi:hypothetical protein